VTGTTDQRHRSLVLSVLVLAYTFNFIDRTIIGTIGQAIKEDLALTDAELGLLGGLSFAVFYTILGIPIARLAERGNRVNIIAWATVVWSAFTALCGVAQTYWQLMLARVGVGVGEAGLSPAAHSLISDYYPAAQRATALSIYSLGIPLGVMFGAAAGGWMADHLSWRAAFILVGLPGVLVALAVKFLVREPPRGQWDAQAATVEKTPPFTRVLARLFGGWGIVHMLAGVTLVSMAAYGVSQYSAAYFIRTFGLSYSTVGLVFGLVTGVGTGIGTLLGGYLADWAGRRSTRWYALAPAIGVSLAFPMYAWAYSASSWQAAAWILILPGIFHFTYVGPSFAVVQNSVEPRMRATAAAILLFIVNFVGLGFGPPLCGWLIDQFSAAAFAESTAGAFAAMCPGGIGAPGASATLDAACRHASAQGAREGILLMLSFFAWGAIHYYLAAATLPRRLEAQSPLATEAGQS
jgi:predicted MFS family arabinose efflux permease